MDDAYDRVSQILQSETTNTQTLDDLVHLIERVSRLKSKYAWAQKLDLSPDCHQVLKKLDQDQLVASPQTASL